MLTVTDCSSQQEWSGSPGQLVLPGSCDVGGYTATPVRAGTEASTTIRSDKEKESQPGGAEGGEPG
jgi:hypothetical protein